MGWTGHGLIGAGLQLANEPGLAGYWRFGASLLELPREKSHCWGRGQSMICLGGAGQLQVCSSVKRRVQDFGPGSGEPTAACRQWFDQTWAELCCEGRIGPGRPALGLQDPEGNRRWHWDLADWFGSVQGLWWGWIIGFWRRFWGLLDSGRSSTDGSAFCAVALRRWCKWAESAQGPSQLNSRFSRAAPCLLFFASLPWISCSVGLGMGG